MSKKLLLADDSITIQKVIQITFAHEDYELTITDNGDAALGKAREIIPDLVMTDIYMPGKNGYELTSAIKQDPALQHIPVLLLAGSFEPFDEDKARQCRADAWIEKPFESQSLIDKVAELLSAARPAAPVTVPAAAVTPAMEISEPVVMQKPVVTAPPVAMRPALDDDPFGDISFEDEENTPVEPPGPLAMEDDWSDIALEPAPAPAFAPAAVRIEAVEDVVEDDVAAEEFAFSEELPEAAAETEEDFTFAEETLPEMPVAAFEDFAFAAKAPQTESAFAAFDAAEDEIMPLGDDDILGAEDLEPLAGEQTLTPWSRDTIEEEDVFAEPLGEDTPDEFVAAAPVVTQDFPVGDFVQPEEDAPFAAAFETDLPEATVAFEPELPPVAPAAALSVAEVEKRVAAVSEDEIERIIESVVSRIVEKLAGSILEKVAWEVVPDLAESLIREEISRIRDDAA